MTGPIYLSKKLNNRMVGLRGLKLNAELVRYARDLVRQKRAMLNASTTPSNVPYRAPRWRVRDRLSSQDIVVLITAFKAGTAKHVLAKRYGINERSLKKLLREGGAKRRSRWDIEE